ncbi:NIPSNAP family protein [Psychromarinibacter sp. S121]|uniref:NIPSNAP family protein n=1 Tax=Psychromarinibacter sp. S121 TaxID=3415127 RepID=UPI003C79E2C5
MFFELRTYDLKPGKATVYLEFFRTFGLGLVTRHLPLGGYWMTESGALNRIEHLWIYESFQERDACRASLLAERAWMDDFIPKAFVDVVAQQNRIMLLERSSPSFDDVIASRRNSHPNEAQSAPMFANRLNGLSYSGSALSGDALAGFRVVSGTAPGSHVTLTANDFNTLTAPEDGVFYHEILRPLGFSPLR